MGDCLRYFDLHCDTAYECYVKNQEFYVNQLAVNGKGTDLFDEWCQFFAIWVKDDKENPFSFYKSVFNDFKAKLSRSNKAPMPFFSVEGGAVLEGDLERLHILKNDGVKLLTLTWNGENALGGGCKIEKGLTDFGKSAIKLMNSLKIGCDLSHLNRKSFYSALELAEFPLASHSNCQKFCDNPRNLNDEQIDLLCRRNGIIGLCFYPEFLGENVFEKIYQNIFYLCDKGFEDNIAIGSDFDGGIMGEELNCLQKVPVLYSFLNQKGLNKALLDKIFYINAYNYIAKL